MNGNALMSILEMAKGFQKEIEEMKNTMRSNHQDEIRRIEQNFALEKRQINETHQSECNTYKIDIKQKNAQITNLNNLISGKTLKINSLESSLTEKIRLIEGFQQTIKDNNIQIGTLQGSLDKKIRENDDLRRINGDKDREYGKIKNELNEKIQSNGSLQSRLNTKENENKDLKIKLQNKENENSNLRNSERAKGDENARLERRLREANQKIDNLNSTINAKNNENRNLQSRIDNYIGLDNPNNRDVEILSCTGSKYQENFVIDMAKTAIQTCKDERDKTFYMSRQIANKLGNGWNILLVRHKGFCISYSCKYDESDPIFYFRIGTYYIFIFKGADYGNKDIFCQYGPKL